MLFMNDYAWNPDNNNISFSLFDACSHGFPSVIGRNLLTLKDFNSDEIKYLLWTAADLKKRIKNGKEVMKVHVNYGDESLLET